MIIIMFSFSKELNIKMVTEIKKVFSKFYLLNTDFSVTILN